MTPLELIACVGVMLGFGAAAAGFGSVALTVCQSLAANQPVQIPVTVGTPQTPVILGTPQTPVILGTPQTPVILGTPQTPVILGTPQTPGAAPVTLPQLPAQLTFREPHPSARCPVCCTGIQGKVRMCPRCRVLSHDDCWEFQGGCAIFGCCESAQA